MTLPAQLEQKLAALAPFAAGEQVVDVEHDGRRLECRLAALDTLGCAFTRLALRTDSLASLSIEQLKATAEKLSARLTYLLEPISPIETDSQGCIVQMRSNPPHKDSDRTTYYELLVSRAGELALCRYSRAGAGPRAIIPAHVTREVLSRLVADFSLVAG
jgi:hypothetical protein